ncbi:hypothetical protein ACA910_016253 [Epithemia clementina (nom. ined.)]
MGRNNRLSEKKRRKLDRNLSASAQDVDQCDGSGGDEPSTIDGRKMTSRGEGKDNEIHPGSFANPSQRKMFGLEIPELDALDKKEAPKELGKTEEEEKRVKRKVAFLLAYLGTNYGGFQMNPDQRTLQAEFELALFRCKLLSQSNFGYPYKYGWSTSGRTDKGVHACAQVCSAKIEIRPNQTMSEVLEELNQSLPNDIRVLDVKRVSKPFCAKTQRDRVRYQYMIPSFLFQDTSVLSEMFEKAGIRVKNREPNDWLSREEIASLQPQMKTFRASSQHLDLLKQALKTYEGTHSFHNFTKGVKNDEARANRYIISFRIEDPMVFENGTEWIPTQVLGQSFLLHQIRKMILMAVEVTRGAVPLSLIERAFSRDVDIRVHPAPAQGLYLDMSFYGGYNKRKHLNPDLPDLDWTNEDSDVYRRWKQFRNEVLMKHVVEEEGREGNFVSFLACHQFGDNRKYYDLDNIKDNDQEHGTEAYT